MATENFLWGQKRIQAELARLGVPVSARTVAKYMRGIHRGRPSPALEDNQLLSQTQLFCHQQRIGVVGRSRRSSSRRRCW
jgi:hypothetical protein